MKKHKYKIIIILIILFGVFIQYKYINFITSINKDEKMDYIVMLINTHIYLDRPDTYNTIYYDSGFQHLISFDELRYDDKKMRKILKYKYWKKNEENICQDLYNSIIYDNDEIYNDYIKYIPSFFSLDNYYYYIDKENDGRNKHLLIANVHTNTIYYFTYAP